jgi:hypothetical protein
MGKGLAKDFKRIYPEMFAQYRELCERRKLDIGKLWLYKTTNKWVLNFPTKKHWRYPSKPEYIESGLERFVQIYSKAGIHSIAFPALGCGNGELDYEDQVKPLMEKYLSKLPINVFIYLGRTDPYPPEHRTPEEIKKWLRSEPESLSFNEVWDDLRRVLAEKKSFKTFSAKSRFNAWLHEESKAIVVDTSNRKYTFAFDKLLDFWQQLRRYGFALRRIAPNGLERQTSYLVPIFASLEYVKPVFLTEDYESLNINPSIALQYLPLTEPRSKQGELFCRTEEET